MTLELAAIYLGATAAATGLTAIIHGTVRLADALERPWARLKTFCVRVGLVVWWIVNGEATP